MYCLLVDSFRERHSWYITKIFFNCSREELKDNDEHFFSPEIRFLYQDGRIYDSYWIIDR